MKTYWSVATVYDNKGNVKRVGIGSVRSLEKPKRSIIQNIEYHDYFDTYEEAEKYKMGILNI